MSYLEQVRILGHQYDITYEPDKFGSTQQHGRTYGCLDDYNMKIVLENGCRPDLMASTLLHEIIHAIDLLNCLGLKEDQVAPLSQGLYQVIRDNPKVVAAIMKWEKDDDSELKVVPQVDGQPPAEVQRE